MDIENVMTGEGELRFAIVVNVPAHQAHHFANAMTGDDDDIILAAQTAMWEFGAEFEEIVLSLGANERRVKAELHRAALRENSR